MQTKLFIALQYLVPQRALSRLVGRLAESRIPVLKNLFIRWFVQRYQVNMAEAEQTECTAYQSFNDFFTRALKAGARPIVAGEKLLSGPADGAISQLGAIYNGRIFQAKGQEYSLLELVGGDQAVAAPFADGNFATVYLSPKDYHRVHMPIAGRLMRTVYVPGELFSVNTATAAKVPRLFARNERLVCIFDTAAGPMAMILVGAMIVAGIETVWAGQVTPPSRKIFTQNYAAQQPPQLQKGEEMGRFKLGSTVIMLFGADRVRWLESLNAETPVRMGEQFGEVL